MISFFVARPLHPGATIELDEAAAMHARARRIGEGEAARLLDGQGTVATGAIAAVAKRSLTVRVNRLERVEAPPALEVLVPVADKERMLTAAEKCAELQVSSWRPVLFARSRSVNPRGEGQRFREKVQARMQSALEQSGGAWLPAIHEELELDDALDAVSAEKRLVLDSRGTSIEAHISRSPIALLIGPEGGIETAEMDRIAGRGWQPVSLATTILRFETAVIASVAAVRALQLGH